MKELLEWLLKQRKEAEGRRSRVYTRMEEAFCTGQISILNEVINHVKFLVEEEENG